MKKRRSLRYLALVRQIPGVGIDYGLTHVDLVYLGEIPQTPGHGVFVEFRSGKVHSGMHIDQFRELTDREC